MLAIQTIVFGMGCFWGAEKYLNAITGVLSAESGYSNGDLSDATYELVLAHEREISNGTSQKRNHAEVVKVKYDSNVVPTEKLIIHFLENHNPTQINAQGNDQGTNYRSAIYYTQDEQAKTAKLVVSHYQKVLTKSDFGTIATEIEKLSNYHTAEEYHQKYLAKNPNGYCGLGGTGVKYEL